MTHNFKKQKKKSSVIQNLMYWKGEHKFNCLLSVTSGQIADTGTVLHQKNAFNVGNMWKHKGLQFSAIPWVQKLISGLILNHLISPSTCPVTKIYALSDFFRVFRFWK